MKNTKNFYITTPIFYPNNQLHLGHSYTVTIADIIARYKKMQGYNVYLQTGSDEHGEKIAKTAIANNLTAQELVDKNVLLFKKLWKELNIIEDHFFMRTSFDFHKKSVQNIFETLLKKGDIYFGKYKGNYCIICEEYILDSKTNKEEKNVCPFCRSDLKQIEEDAYFLKIEKYRKKLICHYEEEKNFLSPEKSVNELFQSFLNKEIPDLCVTRNDLSWGIEVPEKKGMTIYVWFDALCNYLTSKEGEIFFSEKNIKNNEDEIVQVIGKDILRFHAVYWISLLFALEKKIPKKLISHGWILNSGSKMSKSKGNVIDPLSLLNKYESDVLRAYFAGKISLYQDGILDEQLLDNFYKNFFIKDLGNLFSRVYKMTDLYVKREVPKFNRSENEYLSNYYEQCKKTLENYENLMNNYQITSAFNEIQFLITESNKLISNISPWKLFENKNNDLINETLNYLLNGIKIIAFLLAPISPKISEKIINHLGIEIEDLNFKNVENFKIIEGKKLKELKNHFFL